MTVMGLRRRLCGYREPFYYIELRFLGCASPVADDLVLFWLRRESVELELMILIIEETA
jgi:hypothetical protein